jgi:restriction system protein
MKTWMVRAGEKSRFFQIFKDRNLVSIGWRGVGDLANAKSRDDVMRKVISAYPSYKEQQSLMATSQLFRFANEFKKDDRVVTYDSGSRRYLCGNIVSDYKFVATASEEEFENLRSVKWTHEKARDDLSSPARNSLGAISTIFLISESVSNELWGNAIVDESAHHSIEQIVLEQPLALDLTMQEISETADERIKDRLTKLDGHQMEHLVAGILRAMGFQTRVSPRGPDRGADIIASPDGFGFQEPRIVIEVKHRPTQSMGAPELRSFIGGRHQRDKGLYVSTGGFTKEARYEADRASIPLTTWDFDELTSTLLRHYEKLDQETKQLIPLKSIYWPLED